jgi:hypothetical protein
MEIIEWGTTTVTAYFHPSRFNPPNKAALPTSFVVMVFTSAGTLPPLHTDGFKYDIARIY